MKRLSTTDRGFAEAFAKISERNFDVSAEVSAVVSEIIRGVRERGDAALEEYSRKFDRSSGVREIDKEQMRAAAESLDGGLLAALKLCAERVRTQSERELPRRVPETSDATGVTLGKRFSPVRRVGLYVPGGRAAYPSSLIMAAVPARTAGVEEFVAMSPIDPAAPESQTVLAAAHLMGVDRFFTAGGAQAVAAMAFGTARVPKVDVIVGPGNSYVAEAKRQLYGFVNIEGVAGPTEVVILADETLPPAWAAADLMAQAEHGPDSRCLLITTDAAYADAVEKEAASYSAQAPRRDIIERSLGDFGAVITARDWDEAAMLADEFGPEHLMLACSEADRLLAKIRNAGAVFVGATTPEALGDYTAGSNHILPTAGTVRFFSPVSPMTFLRSTNIIRASREGMKALADSTIRLAKSEGLFAHALSVELRATEKKEE